MQAVPPTCPELLLCPTLYSVLGFSNGLCGCSVTACSPLSPCFTVEPWTLFSLSRPSPSCCRFQEMYVSSVEEIGNVHQEPPCLPSWPRASLCAPSAFSQKACLCTPICRLPPLCRGSLCGFSSIVSSSPCLCCGFGCLFLFPSPLILCLLALPPLC